MHRGDRIPVFPARTRALAEPPIAALNARAAELSAEGRELINLGQAVLGISPPPSALDAVRRYLQQAVHGYSPDPGLQSVRERVARHLREVKGIRSASAEELILTCGANQAFVNALFTVTNPGDEVILFGPHYFDHVYAIRLAGCVDVEVALRRRGRGFELDLEAIEAAIGEKTRCISLVSPANPAGMVVSEKQLEALCALCEQHGLWLLSDETYDLLCFEPHQHCCPASLGLCSRVLTVGSFSKTFALAAWRVGYLHGDVEVMREALKVQDALVVCAPVPGQLAVEAALDDAKDFAAQARQVLLERLGIISAGFGGHPDFELLEAQGASFLLARLRCTEDDVAYSHALLDRVGLILVPGSAFGEYGRGYLRIAFGNVPSQALELACERIADFRMG
ncbi:MAG: pyridoxal phosphate-dependent aminotransferase [Myxococcota bacterium]|nr:pyridoxal phosphate-dependent aminotransferase [Myxococcota bacterium]